jgi:hypothetical protein
MLKCSKALLKSGVYKLVLVAILIFCKINETTYLSCSENGKTIGPIVAMFSFNTFAATFSKDN